MRNAHPKYMCFPSVVCVGRETEVMVYPMDLSRAFREEKRWSLTVVDVYGDEMSYLVKVGTEVPCTVKDGCLSFVYRFEREQEYSIRFRAEGGAETRVTMYAVEEDLYALRPLKGDLHTHTYYSDGQDGIPMTPADYREEGFDFFALTDHNRYYPSELVRELFAGVPLGMHIMNGEEVHTPGSSLHIVHVGGRSSVCEKYIHDPEGYEAAVDAIEATLGHVPEAYRRRVAMAHWACDEIHRAGGLAIFPHPFWKPNRNNVSDDFCRILFAEKIFDAFELMGGNAGIPNKNNMQLALWQEQAFRGNVMPVVGSSDSHDHDFETNPFGRVFTIAFAKENSTEAIMDAIRSGYSVAGELPLEYADDARFYGAELRLIRFAHFLYFKYFAETWRLCVGEGILMRRYAAGEPVEDVLAALEGTVERFYRRFYGLDPLPGVPEARMAFLDRCLQKQRTQGPLTKGSTLVLGENNGRRE